jgi:hypothetical protein
MATPTICPLCNREMVEGPSTDRHHLVPKSLGGKEQFLLHKVCHRKIHSLFSERELQKKFNNWEILKSEPQIQKFIQWVSKKPPEFMDKNITANRRRR